jgi:hypothetical protein
MLVSYAGWVVVFKRTDADAIRQVAVLWQRYRELDQLPLDEERNKARRALEERVAEVRSEYFERKLWRGYDRADELLKLIQKPEQAEVRASDFQRKLASDMRQTRDSEPLVLTSGARRLLRLTE